MTGEAMVASSSLPTGLSGGDCGRLGREAVVKGELSFRPTGKLPVSLPVVGGVGLMARKPGALGLAGALRL